MSHITTPATLADGERILEILESSAAKGSIELLYTRRPNAVASYQKESPDTRVFAVREGDRIIATAAEIVRDVYIGGEKKKLCYVCGLKKDAQYEGTVNWGKLFIRSLVREDISCYFCSIISDNQNAIRLFEKKRRKTLNMELLQQYTTFIFSSKQRFYSKRSDLSFKRATDADRERITAFLNEEGKKRDLFPVIYDIESFENLKTTDFYILCDGERIVAVGAAWNQNEYRQYVVKSYNGIMKLARLANPLLSMLGYIKLPKCNAPLSFPMLSFFIARDGHADYLECFLSHITREIQKSYPMFVIGCFSNDPLYPILRKRRSISFDSRIYSIEFLLGGGNVTEINKDTLFLECGTL